MQGPVVITMEHITVCADRTNYPCQDNVDKSTKRRRTHANDWRTRMNFLLQYSKSPGDPIRMYCCKKDRTPLLRPSPAEARLWSESFDALLGNKYARIAFRAFLKLEFSEENMDFWLASEDYRQTKSSRKRSSKARKIYNEFIGPDACREINIDFLTKEMIANNLHSSIPSCFDAAQRRVYSLMLNNAYPRFIQSEFYQGLCRETEDDEADVQWYL
ncbi:regulator of G-protein signaling 2-like [Protopterus annectens]|uniref:regulator of G-protein signaling 2-like n=1 Tax=Protopterus annectens TaxID=7888 RepID=UPI001CF93D5A|nr:regulator of G-protein signaling 2-like [Protopterus annectens]